MFGRSTSDRFKTSGDAVPGPGSYDVCSSTSTTTSAVMGVEKRFKGATRHRRSSDQQRLNEKYSADLEAQNRELRAQLESAMAELNDVHALKDDMCVEMTQTVEQLSTLECKLSAMEETHGQQLQSMEGGFKEKIAQLTSEKFAKEEAHEQLSHEYEKSTLQLQRANLEIENHERKLLELQVQAAMHKEAARDLQAQLSACEEENAHGISMLQQKLDHTQALLEQKCGEIGKLLGNNDIRRELERKTCELTEAQAEIHHLKKEIEILRLQEANTSGQQNLRQRIQMHQKLKQEHAELRAQNKQLHHRITQLLMKQSTLQPSSSDNNTALKPLNMNKKRQNESGADRTHIKKRMLLSPPPNC